MNTPAFVVWFADIDIHETSRIGKAGKHLGSLTQAGFPIPPGFVITQDAYKAFLKQQFLDEKIRKLLMTINYNRPETVHQVMQHIQNHMQDIPLPDQLIEELENVYTQVAGTHLELHAHASSPHAHKIAKHEADTFEDILEAIKDMWIRQFDPNIHWKRHEHNLDHIASGIEIIVQMAIQPDQKGKIHTIDPHEHVKHVMVISHEHPHASDTYILSKKTFVITDRHLTHHNKAPKLSHEALLTLANLGKSLEQHLYFPQEIAWGMIDDAVFIINTRPLSTLSTKKPEPKKKIAHAKGTSVTSTIGTGVVRVILEEKDLEKITAHDVVVLKKLDKKHLDKLKHVRAIITETGEKNSEIAVHIRQLGIPTIFHIKDATKRYKNGRVITVHAAHGHIYRGSPH